MLTATEKQAVKKALLQYEGNVPYMYLDSNGYVTVGIGHMMRTAQDAQKLPFIDSKKKKATAADIKTDFDNVKKQLKNMKHTYYKKFTKLTLDPLEVNKQTEKHISNSGKELKVIFPEFDKFPSEVKLALYDIIFNVGMPNLNKGWALMKAAIKAKDWAKAGKESNRKPPVSAERNKYVKDLFDKAAKKP